MKKHRKARTKWRTKARCDACENGAGETIAWEIDCMERFGWYVHYVTDDPTGANIHTHGLGQTFDHLDLQVVVRLLPHTAQGLLAAAVDLVRAGRRFQPGATTQEILENGMEVAFALATESGREVLRMILPDERGRLDPRTMSPLWASQWRDCS